MTENEKINGWTFEETIKTAENIMEVEQNMFKCDVLRHLRDFAEMYEEELQRYRALGTVEELRLAKEKQIPKKPIQKNDASFKEGKCFYCPNCKDSLATNGDDTYYNYWLDHCDNCGQTIDWSDTD